MLKLLACLFLIVVVTSNFLLHPAPNPGTPSAKTARYFNRGLAVTIHRLSVLENAASGGKNTSVLRTGFRQARWAYKQVEALVEYYYPHLVRNINGPALPFADGENSLRVFEPQGFQVLEEMLYGEAPVHRANLRKQVRSLKQVLSGILNQRDPYGFQDRYILDAMRLQVYRMIGLGITGFDSPVSFNSISEANAVVVSLDSLVSFYLPAAKDTAFERRIQGQLKAAGSYLSARRDFNNFDRLYFIKEHADPISVSLSELAKRLDLVLPEERQMLSPAAPHLFATSFYSASGYSPNAEANATNAKGLLGKKLFFDPVLSAGRQRSCASCHQPGRAFTDGLAKSLALDTSRFLQRNAPTLWNVVFQPKLFYDSRANFVEDQVLEVVHNVEEMGGSMQLAIPAIAKDSAYLALFADAYGPGESLVNGENIANAIASYLRSLIGLNSRFDRYMNGENSSLADAEKKGFNVFMGKAKCATCHFVPLFNGVAPPYFREAESEVIGVPDRNDTVNAKLDGDLGKFNLYPISILRHSFKTPTLRNIELTAPYMHNGVFERLEQVIDFYDKGGGAGLGIAPNNQTLPANRLHLGKEEKAQLIAFLHALTDTAERR